jgi:hypothetical protein
MRCSLVTARSIDAVALGKFKALFLHGFLAQASPQIPIDFFSALIRQKMLDRELGLHVGGAFQLCFISNPTPCRPARTLIIK